MGQGTKVVGSGNIDLGEKAPPKPERPLIERLPGIGNSPEPRIARPQTTRPSGCGAMSQQCGNIGNASAPQKFIQLVGYREPKARPKLPGLAKS